MIKGTGLSLATERSDGITFSCSPVNEMFLFITCTLFYKDNLRKRKKRKKYFFKIHSVIFVGGDMIFFFFCVM